MKEQEVFFVDNQNPGRIPGRIRNREREVLSSREDLTEIAHQAGEDQARETTSAEASHKEKEKEQDDIEAILVVHFRHFGMHYNICSWLSALSQRVCDLACLGPLGYVRAAIHLISSHLLAPPSPLLRCNESLKT